MTCPNCNALIDAEMQFCMKCGAATTFSCDTQRGRYITFWPAGKVLFWVSLCLVLFFAFWPMASNPHPTPPTVTVMSRGKDIYVAIVSANVDREPLGLPSLWPKTCVPNTNYPGDVSSRIYTTSSDYFYELYDGVNLGNDLHDPYVKGFDYCKLAGAGVPAKKGGGKLSSANNLWIIAANITDQDDDRIPFLITRNVDVKEIERVVNQGLKESDFNKEITFSKVYRSPFNSKEFVAVRKDGSSKISGHRFKIQNLGELFGNKELPPRDPSKPPIVYLMP